MKKVAAISAFFVIASVSAAGASNVGFNVNVNVGNQPPAAPIYANPPVVVEEPPEFVMPPALGFYVAVGVPYDMMLVSNFYYVHKGNVWYRSPSYNGPWAVAPYKNLPPGIRKQRFEKIRYYRDEEYRRYHGNEAHYQGRHFRPEKELKERRKEERREIKEENKHEKDSRREEAKREHDERGHGRHGERN